MFDWNEYLVLAERLARDQPNEAMLRSAISRAYYAVYHRASQYIRSKSLVLPSQRLDHKIVWRTIKSGSDLRRQDVGNRGDALKQKRVKADYYGVFQGDLPRSTQDALLEAQELLDLIDKL
jgi:uncharacterized protein (UPF0332 family)